MEGPATPTLPPTNTTLSGSEFMTLKILNWTSIVSNLFNGKFANSVSRLNFSVDPDVITIANTHTRTFLCFFDSVTHF